MYLFLTSKTPYSALIVSISPLQNAHKAGIIVACVCFSQEKKKEQPKNYAKEEIKVLHLSENSQQMVMETLKFIHGRVSRTSF